MPVIDAGAVNRHEVSLPGWVEGDLETKPEGQLDHSRKLPGQHELVLIEAGVPYRGDADLGHVTSPGLRVALAQPS